jgi:hypothetical protein
LLLKTRNLIYLAVFGVGIALLVPLLVRSSSFVITDGNTYVVMDDSNGATGTPLHSGLKAHIEYITSQSSLAGKEIDAIQLGLSRTGSPSGTATVGIFDSKLAPVKSFGTIDAGSVTTTDFKDYVFSPGSSSGGGYVLQPGDGVGILYDGGDKDNYLSVRTDAAGHFDGSKTFHKQYSGTGWTGQLGSDMYMKLTGRHEPAIQRQPKYVMIHFDDGFRSQHDYAYPVLEQYGLKGTFWIVCDYASGTRPDYMRWTQVDELAAAGHDIQNHGMTHAHLPTLTDGQIVREISGCKGILMQHGSTGDAYAIPFDEGHDDPRVVGIISKIHSYGKGAPGIPQRADCGGNCEITNADNGTYNENNKYTMEQWSHDAYSRNSGSGRTEQEILDGFVKAVNTAEVDASGQIVKVPIITYHRINEGGTSPSTSLFAAEMKYLRDNGFRTIGMNDITYDAQAEKFKLR